MHDATMSGGSVPSFESTSSLDQWISHLPESHEIKKELRHLKTEARWGRVAKPLIILGIIYNAGLLLLLAYGYLR